MNVPDIKIRLYVGDYIVVSGDFHKIQRLTDASVFLEGIDDPFSNREIWELLQSGVAQLRGVDYDKYQRQIVLRAAIQFDAYPQRHRDEALLRQRILIEIESCRFKLLPTDMESIAWRHFREAKKRKSPSYDTIQEWWNIWRAANRDPIALIPRHLSKGNREPRKSEREIALAKRIASMYYNSPKKRTKTNVYSYHYQRWFRRALKRGVIPPESVPLSYKAFSALIKHDSEKVVRAREGEGAARTQFGVTGRRHGVSIAGREAQLDFTPLNGTPFCEYLHIPLRPLLLCTAMDVASGYPLGFSLTFAGESLLAMKMCIQHALRSKDYIQRQWPGLISNTWHETGAPDRFLVDNLRAAHAQMLGPTLDRLHLPIFLSGSRCPWHKGLIEVINKIIQNGLSNEFSGQIGQSFEQIRLLTKHQSGGLSLSTIRLLIHIYLIDIYAQMAGRKIPNVPARTMLDSIALHGIRPVVDTREVDMLSTKIVRKSLRGGRIDFAYMKYGSEDLKRVRANPAVRQNDEWVEVGVDEYDLSRIFVMNPGEGWIQTPCMEPQHIAADTMAQHNAVIRLAKKYYGDRVTEETIRKAREIIIEVIEKGTINGRRSRDVLVIQKEWSIGQENMSADGSSMSITGERQDSKSSVRRAIPKLGIGDAGGESKLISKEGWKIMKDAS